jgi:hypothetical protein
MTVQSSPAQYATTLASSGKKRRSRSPKRDRDSSAGSITVPPVHPLYGPAVYDHNQHIWTYPYAGYYNVDQHCGAGQVEPGTNQFVPLNQG